LNDPALNALAGNLGASYTGAPDLIGTAAVAEQTHYEFAAIEAKDVIATHERGWEGFTQFVTYGVVAVVALLLLLLLLVA
jgi:hypothetical protein